MSDTPKTEKQKMLAGELYLANNAELAAESQRALRLLRLYNQTTETEPDKRIQTTLRSTLAALLTKTFPRMLSLWAIPVEYCGL